MHVCNLQCFKNDGAKNKETQQSWRHYNWDMGKLFNLLTMHINYNIILITTKLYLTRRFTMFLQSYNTWLQMTVRVLPANQAELCRNTGKHFDHV